METGEAVRTGVHSAQAAVPPEHPRRKGRAGVCPQRGADRLLTSGCGCCGSSPDSDRGDSCRAGATASLPDCLLHSSSMPLSRTKRAAGGRRSLAHSHSAKPQSFAFLRGKITGSSSRGRCHTNRADTSHFRERVASTRRAGAVSQRARNASASVVAGRRKKGREERAQEERDLTTLCGGGAASF